MSTDLYFKNRMFRVGHAYKLNHFSNMLKAPGGITVTIQTILDTYEDEYIKGDIDIQPTEADIEDDRYLLGIKLTDGALPKWGDLHGIVAPNTGYWAKVTVFHSATDDKIAEVYYVKVNLKFRGINLKGMSCRLISFIEGKGPDAFVEFAENIGGSSGDGNGLAGHCLPIDSKCLTTDKKEIEVDEISLSGFNYI